ncbi:MAG: Spy/CpxP family protein refolding chaperone [Acidobacteria bacterium]|nr:Spy/CpxP family protein refolding chaperone [Acidobacteriota bacterium]
MKIVLSSLLLLAFGLSAAAQHHPAGDSPEQDQHHVYLQLERDAIEQGQGFGMARVADRNGYPGPRHILDLAPHLHLTPEQIANAEALFAAMRQDALALGGKLLENEAALEKLFAAGAVDSEAARRMVEDSAVLRAQLRWVHLSAHLKAYNLLTAEQRARYHDLRYGSDEHAH